MCSDINVNYIDYDVQSKCLHSSKKKSESMGKSATEYLREYSSE